MLSDTDFDVVYFSEYLKHPISSKDQGLDLMFQRLEKILNKHGYVARTLSVKAKLVQNGLLSLCRWDYMSIHTVGTEKHAIFYPRIGKRIARIYDKQLF